MSTRFPLDPTPGEDADLADLQPIDVDRLCVGQFVHVDTPWSSHPFSVSDFRITGAGQLAALRALGAGSVRWSPILTEDAAGPPPAAQSRHAQRVLAELQRLWTTDDAPGSGPTPEPTAPQADDESGDDDVRLDPARCRTQLIEASRDAAAVMALLLPPAGSADAGERGDAAAAGLPPDLQALRSADAVRGALRLAGALSSKLTAVPSAYIRVLCEDATPGPPHRQQLPHAIHVGVLSLLLGRAVELDDAALHDLLVGALLHDVGKLVLAGRLGRSLIDAVTDPGGALHEQHVAAGVEWGRRAGLSEGALRVLAQHHERADGSGFPLRLPLARLGLPSRIVSLVNRYDNLCNPSPPDAGLAPHMALAQLFAAADGEFDAPLLRSFIRLMGVYPPGSLVQLSDERYARVVGTNRQRPLRPPVRLLGGENGAAASQPLLLDADPVLRIQRSLTVAELPPPQRDWLGSRAGDPFAFADATAS